MHQIAQQIQLMFAVLPQIPHTVSPAFQPHTTPTAASPSRDTRLSCSGSLQQHNSYAAAAAVTSLPPGVTTLGNDGVAAAASAPSSAVSLLPHMTGSGIPSVLPVVASLAGQAYNGPASGHD
jgi:hypothetical protein